MNAIRNAIFWAAAILALATASALGFIAKDVASTLMIVLPIVAILSLNGRVCARLPRGETQ